MNRRDLFQMMAAGAVSLLGLVGLQRTLRPTKERFWSAQKLLPATEGRLIGSGTLTVSSEEAQQHWNQVAENNSSAIEYLQTKLERGEQITVSCAQTGEVRRWKPRRDSELT